MKPPRRSGRGALFGDLRCEEVVAGGREGTGREIGLYKVKDGKVIEERFYGVA